MSVILTKGPSEESRAVYLFIKSPFHGSPALPDPHQICYIISFQLGGSEIDHHLPSTELTTLKIYVHLNFKNK